VGLSKLKKFLPEIHPYSLAMVLSVSLTTLLPTPNQRRAAGEGKARVSVNTQVAQIFSTLFVQPD
jgi:hypothetical protein